MHERILVVDDEVSFTHVVKRGLELLGHYEVREENSSPNAVSAARQFRPHLILMDLMMPEMNGLEVATQLKKDQDLSGTPVLFVTAAPLTDGVPEGFGAQAQEYPFLAKPVHFETLLARVREQIQAH
jgi:CheY-like chemotaxis protein